MTETPQLFKMEPEFVDCSVPIKQECFDEQLIKQEEDVSTCVKSEPFEVAVEIADDFLHCGNEEISKTNLVERQTCDYFGCANNSIRKKGLHFYRIPVEDKTRLQTWLQNMGQEKFLKLEDRILQDKRICSEHFKFTDFTYKFGSEPELHPLATPGPRFSELNTCASNPAQEIKVYTKGEKRKRVSFAEKPVFITPKSSNVESVVKSFQTHEPNNTLPGKDSKKDSRMAFNEQALMRIWEKMKLSGRFATGIEYSPLPTDKENTTLSMFPLHLDSSIPTVLLPSYKENPRPRSSLINRTEHSVGNSAAKSANLAAEVKLMSNINKQNSLAQLTNQSPTLFSSSVNTFDKINLESLPPATNQTISIGENNQGKIISVQRFLVPTSAIGNFKGLSVLNKEINQKPQMNHSKAKSLNKLDRLSTTEEHVSAVHQQHLLSKISRLNERLLAQSRLLRFRKYEISRLLKEKESESITKEQILMGLNQYLTGDALTFTKNQLMRTPQYPNEFKKFVITLYDLSWSAYCFLKRRGFQLPSKETVKKWKREMKMLELITAETERN